MGCTGEGNQHFCSIGSDGMKSSPGGSGGGECQQEARAVASWGLQDEGRSLLTAMGRGALINQPFWSLFQIARLGRDAGHRRWSVVPWASVAGSKIIWEEVLVVIDPRDLQGPGVGEGWVSWLIKQLVWSQSGCLCSEDQLSIFGSAEFALLVMRILKHRQDSQPLGT